MESICSFAVICVLFSLSSGSLSFWFVSVPRRTWMNSSRLEMKMERNLHLSSRGLVRSIAWSSTLLLNDSQLISRFS